MTLAEHDGEAWVWHLNDGLGSVRQLVGRSGDVTLAQGYTPFGVPMWSQGSGVTDYGFTGERWEAYSALLFLRARYYEPGTGRFVTPDLWAGDYYQPSTLSHNYLFALNNPVLYVDPSGLSCCLPLYEEDAFFPSAWPRLEHSEWELPYPWPISLAEVEIGLKIGLFVNIDLGSVTLFQGGSLEMWSRYISKVQEGESWRVRTCLTFEGIKPVLEWDKLYPINLKTTMVLAVWRQDLLIVTAATNPPVHYGLGWNITKQPGPWDSSGEPWDGGSNGDWPYDSIDWWN